MEQQKPTEEEKKKKPWLNSYARFSGVAFQMGAIIFAGAYGGKYLDAKYEVEGKWFTMGLTLLAVAISLFTTIRQLNKINK